MPNRFDPDLDSNCLQRFSADDIRQKPLLARKELNTQNKPSPLIQGREKQNWC